MIDQIGKFLLKEIAIFLVMMIYGPPIREQCTSSKTLFLKFQSKQNKDFFGKLVKLHTQTKHGYVKSVSSQLLYKLLSVSPKRERPGEKN